MDWNVSFFEEIFTENSPFLWIFMYSQVCRKKFFLVICANFSLIITLRTCLVYLWALPNAHIKSHIVVHKRWCSFLKVSLLVQWKQFHNFIWQSGRAFASKTISSFSPKNRYTHNILGGSFCDEINITFFWKGYCGCRKVHSSLMLYLACLGAHLDRKPRKKVPFLDIMNCLT